MQLSKLAVCLFFLSLPVLAQDDSLEWLGDYKQALEQARQTKKPIFLEFRCEP